MAAGACSAEAGQGCWFGWFWSLYQFQLQPKPGKVTSRTEPETGTQWDAHGHTHDRGPRVLHLFFFIFLSFVLVFPFSFLFCFMWIFLHSFPGACLGAICWWRGLCSGGWMAPWHSPVSSGTQTRLIRAKCLIKQKIRATWVGPKCEDDYWSYLFVKIRVKFCAYGTISFQFRQLQLFGSPHISCCSALLSASWVLLVLACAHVRGGVSYCACLLSLRSSI